MTDFETLLYTESDGVAWVTLNRPQALNSFDNTMRAELRGLWRALRTNDDVRCVVLTGAGERAFCVGIDRTAEDTYVIFERDTFYGTSNNYMYDDPGDDIGPKANDLWKPVICAVNGMACGGAFYMLAECDIIIAADHATFFDPHVTYGQAAVYEPNMKLLQHISAGQRAAALACSGPGSGSAPRPPCRSASSPRSCRPRSCTTPRRGWPSRWRACRPTSRPARCGPRGPPTTSVPRCEVMAPSILSTATDKDVMRAGNEAFENQPRITPRIR